MFVRRKGKVLCSSHLQSLLLNAPVQCTLCTCTVLFNVKAGGMYTLQTAQEDGVYHPQPLAMYTVQGEEFIEPRSSDVLL
jgi:hypothetical protein